MFVIRTLVLGQEDTLLQWLDELNESQRRAVEHTEGPLLVVAGAGSGKTRVLTYRIAYILQSDKAKPHEILAVTFTNKAAAEMRERLTVLVGPVAESIWVGTFHATCVQILRRFADRLGMKRNFVIFDTSDQLATIRAVLKDLNIDPKNFEPRAVLSAISHAKNELLDPEGYESHASDYFEKNVARMYKHYQKKLFDANAMDFDDLLVLTVRLFNDHPDVLEHYEKRFRYVLIDEYQDTNKVQYELIRLLCEKHRNLCVVGDADQSIYRFRGADIRNILDFERDYDDAHTILLEQNYRSTKTILQGANAVIDHNIDRPRKNLFTDNDTGEKIKRFEAPDERGEVDFIASEIQRLGAEEGFGHEDITILYRTHAMSRTLEEEFMRRGTPYRIVAGLKFYERKEIKDLIAYLRVIANPDDNLSFSRIINVPKRGIGDRTIARIQQYALEHGMSFYGAMAHVDEIEDITAAFNTRISRFYELMEKLKMQSEGMSLSAFVERLIHDNGMVEALREERTIEADARIENLKEFISVTKEFEATMTVVREEPSDEPLIESALEAFLDHVALMSDVDGYDDDVGEVTMMTLHAAKGLEFPVVFLVGMEEGVFPHSRAMFEEGELEEERRLCYVGMTRAEKVLYLTGAKSRTLYGETKYNVPSRFIEEVPAELIDDLSGQRTTGRRGLGGRLKNAGRTGNGTSVPFGNGSGSSGGAGRNQTGLTSSPSSPRSAVTSRPADAIKYVEGDKVKHPTFGSGTIVTVQPAGGDAILTVSFDGVGVKRLMAGMAPLEGV